MEYEQLDRNYRADVLAEALHSREKEHFHFAFDRDNFREMLKTLPAGPFRDQVQERLSQTLARIAEVDAIHAALTAQINDPAAHADAIERTAKKRAALEAMSMTAGTPK